MGSERFSQFGKSIKKALIDMNRSQEWLIEMVRGSTGLYFDRSYLYKIMSGRLTTPKIVNCIGTILDINQEEGNHEPQEKV